jgi:hypothetical protein
MSGVLGLSSPWARRPFPTIDSRRQVEARIPDGYTIGVYCNSNGSAYGVRVIEQGEKPAGNRVVWGGDEQRRYFRDPLVGIDAALAWIAQRQVAA